MSLFWHVPVAVVLLLCWNAIVTSGAAEPTIQQFSNPEDYCCNREGPPKGCCLLSASAEGITNRLPRAFEVLSASCAAVDDGEYCSSMYPVGSSRGSNEGGCSSSTTVLTSHGLEGLCSCRLPANCACLGMMLYNRQPLLLSRFQRICC